MKIALLSFALAIISLGVIPSAHAITIDDFSGDSSLTSTEVAGTSSSAFTVSAGAVGGDRQLTVVQKSSGKGSTRLATLSSELRFTLEANKGEGFIVWDGDRNPATFTFNGLGSIDLTQDGGDAFVIPLDFFDLAMGKPIDIKLKIFDATDAARSSEVSISVDQAYYENPPFPITIPFSLFATAGSNSVLAPGDLFFQTTTTLGANGAAHITSVGAIQLHFVGSAADLYIGSVTTNGRCTSIPSTAGRVIDQCGVCLNNPDANQDKDPCGVCFKGPPGYDYNSNKVIDACGLCPTQTGYSYPSGTKDSCGLCGGTATDPSTCGGSVESCTLVPATEQVKDFERSLIHKAKAVRARFHDERTRAKRMKCPVDAARPRQVVNSAFQHITGRSKQIFLTGVKVCGDSCVTTSYAEQVEALMPEFKAMQKETISLARKVKRCYANIGVPKPNSSGTPGVSDTLNNVDQGLRDLIRRCREHRVCPTGKGR